LIKPEAFVVLKQGCEVNDALANELLEFCKNGLASYKYPRWINFVGELPKTATGKIQRFLLRQAPSMRGDSEPVSRMNAPGNPGGKDDQRAVELLAP
jgi:benzoate-CoA ligase